ncbi:MAG TPA: hypothetical protein VMW46_06015 [Candidatus Desulfaltia sp.]|nr:hypothetical protein [Candidatus Desulfaltia sp.]
MAKKILLFGFLALFSFNLAAMDNPANPKEKAGYVLLDLFITSFQEMVTKGSRDLEPTLLKMASELSKARKAGEIDTVFYTRLGRVLALTKLVIVPDPGRILEPVINREMLFFVHDITGEDLNREGGPGTINQVANAIAEEILNLQIYLDTKDKREALRKKLDERISGKET